MKLGLGTAQFGMPYGIANRGAAPPQEEITRVLDAAAAAGIDCLDTAPLYEDSEQRLGVALQGGCAFRIVTKSPAFANAEIGARECHELRSTLLRSLERLGQARVYGLLVHHANDVLKPGGRKLTETLRALAHEGLVEKIGVSVYTPEQLDRILQVFEPDLVQLPLSVLDQRFFQSGHLDRLKHRQVEVHARSIYLQGVLLMAPGNLPPFLAPLRNTLEEYGAALNAHGMSRMDGALAFVRSMAAVEYAIVGVQELKELHELIAASLNPSETAIDFARYAVADETMILPPRWKR